MDLNERIAQLEQRVANLRDHSEKAAMPFRVWYFAVAIGLTAASISGTGYGQSYEQDAQRSGYPQNYSALADFPFHPASNTETADAGCEQGHEDRKSDLCAQWKAADAAANSADAAWVQLWVGGVIGVATFVAAVAAALYAKRAAGHAASGVAIAKLTGRDGLRPYVGIENAKIVQLDDVMHVEIVIRNFGQTPAIGLVSATHSFIADEDKALAAIRMAHEAMALDEGRAKTLFPGQSFTIASRNEDLPSEMFMDLHLGTQWACFTGKLIYRDNFANECITTWTLKMEEAGTPNQRVYQYGDYNTAT